MENLTAYKKALYHAWFQHSDADGYITLAKKTANGFKQYHYKPEELAARLSEWLGEDVFFSQNTFYKPYRQIENIRQLRALYVDVDCYLLNYDPDWVIGKMELEMFKDVIPEPNLIIFSGQGLVLVWLIEPVPYQALPLWQAVQNYFVEQLKEIGGDTKATDAARVFRLAGTINSKNGEQVGVQYRHNYRYVLRDIQHDYLPEIRTNRTPKKGRPSKIQRLFNTYSLHHARLMDIVKLVELRNYDVKGYRETILFLYRYWSCCYLSDPEEALHQTLFFNAQFKEPLSEREVIRATRSAEKAWNARNNEEANRLAIAKGYPGAGYNLKNSTIIKWLDITEHEQTHLKAIISGFEKRRRKTITNRQKRRESGVLERGTYLKEQKAKTEERIKQLKELIEQYPGWTQKDYARMMGVTPARVSKLMRILKKK